MNTSSNFIFITNPAKRMSIDSAGNLGLGTLKPNIKINVEKEEPLTKWYKDAVKKKGLSPHKLEEL